MRKNFLDRTNQSTVPVPVDFYPARRWLCKTAGAIVAGTRELTQKIKAAKVEADRSQKKRLLLP